MWKPIGFEGENRIYAAWCSEIDKWVTVGWSDGRAHLVDDDQFKRNWMPKDG